jgi:hypothetical protein
VDTAVGAALVMLAVAYFGTRARRSRGAIAVLVSIAVALTLAPVKAFLDVGMDRPLFLLLALPFVLFALVIVRTGLRFGRLVDRSDAEFEAAVAASMEEVGLTWFGLAMLLGIGGGLLALVIYIVGR